MNLEKPLPCSAWKKHVGVAPDKHIFVRKSATGEKLESPYQPAFPGQSHDLSLCAFLHS